RILGAAAARAPGMNASDGKKVTDGHAAHGDTLPKECPAGGGGMNVNFPCIWRANRYKHTNLPINTASLEELQQAGMSDGTARYIIAARSATVRGLDIDEWKTDLGAASEIWQNGVSPDDVGKLDRGFTF